MDETSAELIVQVLESQATNRANCSGVVDATAPRIPAALIADHHHLLPSAAGVHTRVNLVRVHSDIRFRDDEEASLLQLSFPASSTGGAAHDDAAPTRPHTPRQRFP